MKKSFSIEAVLSVTTGALLCDFAELHELFDHYYPGIMHLGMAHMADKGAERVIAEYPGLANATLPELTGLLSGPPFLDAIEPWLVEQRQRFGGRLLLTRDPALETPEQNGVA